MKRKTTALILEQRRLCQGIYSMTLKTDLTAEAGPGQFVGLYTKDASKLLMRPISICDADTEESSIRLVYRAAGGGTAGLSRLAAGETVEILGILGNGYDTEALKGRKLLLLGGGIGIPPMLLLAKKLTDAGNDVTAVLGYADKNAFLKNEFDDVCRTYTASMDGSIGTKGTVIDALNENLISADTVCACGPLPMLKAVKEYAADFGMKAYISLEERMACGVGACLGCMVKTAEKDEHTKVNNARVCTEGPVFDAAAVVL